MQLASLFNRHFFQALLLCLSFIISTKCGILDGCKIVLNGKHITIFGDNHEASTREKNDQQVKEIVESFEETRELRDEPVKVLWEKADLLVEASPSTTCRALVDLEKQFKNSDIEHDTFEDIEVRRVASLCQNLLQKPFAFLYTGDDPLFYDIPLPNEVTFQDFEDEFTIQLKKIYTFWLKNGTKFNLNNIFLISIKELLKQYGIFVKELARENIDLSSSVYEYATNKWKEKRTINKVLATSTFCLSSELFDLNAFITIMNHPGNQIAVFTGRAHGKSLESMLEDQKPEHLLSCWKCFDSTNNESIPLMPKQDLIALLKGHKKTNYFKTVKTVKDEIIFFLVLPYLLTVRALYVTYIFINKIPSKLTR